MPPQSDVAPAKRAHSPRNSPAFNQLAISYHPFIWLRACICPPGGSTMNSGFYSAYAGFAARMDQLEVVANNLANVNTAGFKAQREFYRSFAASLNAPN